MTACDHWAWRHLSVVAVADLGEALRTVEKMSDTQRADLLEAALIAQRLVQLDVPASRTWHAWARERWAEPAVRDLAEGTLYGEQWP
jgi:hypothetical protein